MIRPAALGLAALGLVAACTEEVPFLDRSPQPQARPAGLVVPSVATTAPRVTLAPPPTSGQSEQLRTFYRIVERDLVAQDMLRRDGGGPDTSFTDTMLARNFIQIALFDEYVEQGGQLRAQSTASTLRRWSQPVRIAVEFGPSYDPAQAARDLNSVVGYAARLSRATRHPVSAGTGDGNFHVLFLNEDDRLAIAPRLRTLLPRISPTTIANIVNLPRETYCLVVAFPDATGNYGRAVAVIRGEQPDLMRLSCIHEELAQGLGLANDSPRARPSIFNDDDEFSLLTTHDELLLRILYDPRLRNGMNAEEAAPIVRQIASELVGGPA